MDNQYLLIYEDGDKLSLQQCIGKSLEESIVNQLQKNIYFMGDEWFSDIINYISINEFVTRIKNLLDKFINYPDKYLVMCNIISSNNIVKPLKYKKHALIMAKQNINKICLNIKGFKKIDSHCCVSLQKT